MDLYCFGIFIVEVMAISTLIYWIWKKRFLKIYSEKYNAIKNQEKQNLEKIHCQQKEIEGWNFHANKLQEASKQRALELADVRRNLEEKTQLYNMEQTRNQDLTDKLGKLVNELAAVQKSLIDKAQFLDQKIERLEEVQTSLAKESKLMSELEENNQFLLSELRQRADELTETKMCLEKTKVLQMEQDTSRAKFEERALELADVRRNLEEKTQLYNMEQTRNQDLTDKLGKKIEIVEEVQTSLAKESIMSELEENKFKLNQFLLSELRQRADELTEIEMCLEEKTKVLQMEQGTSRAKLQERTLELSAVQKSLQEKSQLLNQEQKKNRDLTDKLRKRNNELAAAQESVVEKTQKLDQLNNELAAAQKSLEETEQYLYQEEEDNDSSCSDSDSGSGSDNGEDSEYSDVIRSVLFHNFANSSQGLLKKF